MLGSSLGNLFKAIHHLNGSKNENCKKDTEAVLEK